MIDNLTAIIVILIVMNVLSLLFVVASAIAHLHIAQAHHNGDIELILDRLIAKRTEEPMWRGDK